MKTTFIHANEMAEELGISTDYAYKLIRVLNDELAEKGYMTLAGKVSRKYFEEKFYGVEKG